MSRPRHNSSEQPNIAESTNGRGMRLFFSLALNVGAANLIAGFLWFAITYWLYLKIQSVLISGLLGGSYLVLISLVSVFFGSIVDHHRKHAVMKFSSAITFTTFTAAFGIFLIFPEEQLLDTSSPLLWCFVGIVIVGATIERLRGIALSTTVTLLVSEEQRPRANGVVGMVQGLSFIVTNVLSGLAVGLIGMKLSLALAVVATVFSSIHLYLLHIPEQKPATHNRNKIFNISGSAAAVRTAPGLFSLIIFSTLNNSVDGVYLALMDPYGLTLFSVETWGIVSGFATTGTILAGFLISRFGLGRHPLRMLVLSLALASAVGCLFTLRDWPWLYIFGNWLIMAFVTVSEAAEQSTIQRLVPFSLQGRVFGVASTFKSAASPIVSFMISPLAEMIVIPWVESSSGRAATEWILGNGAGRGIALCFVVTNLLALAIALSAFRTRTYHLLSASEN